MIIRKKDWLALHERVAAIEDKHKTLAQTVHENARQMAQNYSDAKRVNSDMKDLIANVLALRATVYGLCSKIKQCFNVADVFTPAEIEKMGSADYACKVLKPLGIQMNSRKLL